MTDRFFLSLIVAVLLTLVGCSNPSLSRSPPAVPGATSGGDGSADNVQQSPKLAEPQADKSAAVNDITELAQEAFEQQNYALAIERAELGLRIDRRHARLYRILAYSYLQLGEYQSARQFADQGLRYTSPGAQQLIQEFQRVLTDTDGY